MIRIARGRDATIKKVADVILGLAWLATILFLVAAMLCKEIRPWTTAALLAFSTLIYGLCFLISGFIQTEVCRLPRSWDHFERSLAT